MKYGSELTIGELITYNFQPYKIWGREERINKPTDEWQIWLDLVSLTGGEPIRAYVHPTSEWEYLNEYGYVPSSEAHFFQEEVMLYNVYARLTHDKDQYPSWPVYTSPVGVYPMKGKPPQLYPDGTRTRFAHFYGVNAIRLAQWHYKGKESLFNMAIVRGEPMTPNQFQKLYNV